MEVNENKPIAAPDPVAQAVVRVSSPGSKFGTGILVAPNKVVTAGHVVSARHLDTKTVWHEASQQEVAITEIVHESEHGLDLALLTLAEDLPCHPLTWLQGAPPNGEFPAGIKFCGHGYPGESGGRDLCHQFLPDAVPSVGVITSTGKMVRLQTTKGGLPEGYSGGPAMLHFAGTQACYGITRLGGDVSHTIILPADEIREFLTRHGINLPARSTAEYIAEAVAKVRRPSKQLAALVLILLLALVAGVFAINQGLRRTNVKVTAVLDRNQKMEQALIRLAEVEKLQQFGEKLTPEQIRQRAYTVLENELGLPAGSLARELPGLALEIYNRQDTTLLMRAHAAFALSKFEEAEKVFLQSEAQDSKAQEHAQRVADQLRKQRIAAFVGAGDSASAQIQYPRALEHYRAAAALTDQQRDPLEWAKVQQAIALVLFKQAKYAEAEAEFRAVLGIIERVLGPEDRGTLASRNNLASALRGQGKYAEAEAEFRAVLAIQERVLGPEDSNTLMSRMNFALAMNDQGKHAEAESEFRAGLAIQERVLGPEHFDTMCSRINLAVALSDQGKHAEAEALDRGVLSIRVRVLGPEHPDTLKSRNNLAVLLNARGKHAEAEAEHRTVVSIMQRVLGPEHPDTLGSRFGLASALQGQEEYAEAEKEYRAVLAITERVLGPEHPDTLKSRNNLAAVLSSQGKHAESEKEHRSTLAIQERSLRPEDPRTALTRNNLAAALFAQRKYAEAEVECRTVVNTKQRVLGPNDAGMVASRLSLARVLYAQQKNTEAEKEYRTVLAIRERVLGPEHSDTLISRDQVAAILGVQGKNPEAEKEYRAILAIHERVHGPTNQETLVSCLKMGICLMEQGKKMDAMAFAQRARAGFLKTLGESHQATRNAKKLVERLEQSQ